MNPTEVARARIEPASFIVAEVGDVARPSGALSTSPDLRHLPGRTGIVPAIQSVVVMATRGIGYQRQLAKENPPVFRGMFGPFETVYVTDPELVAKVLHNEDGAYSSALGWSSIFEDIDSRFARFIALVVLDFEPHRELRRLLQPAFAPGALGRYLEVAYPMFEAEAERWLAAGTVDAKPAIRAVLASVAARIFVGVEDEEQRERLDQATMDAWAVLHALVRNTWIDPNWRKARRGYARLVDLLEPRVRAALRNPTDDLLGRIVSFDAEAPEWLESIEARTRLVAAVLLAAFDTTAHGLASMTYLLAKHPEWQEKLRAEAIALDRRRPSMEEARSLELADRAWKETLRIFPVVGAPPRRALADVELGGYRIPAGAFVMPAIGLMGLDGRVFPDPDRFDPDRFSPSRAEDRKVRGAYAPFGLGAHACIGTQLANAEVRAFVHAMLTRLRFRLAKDYEATHTFGPIGCVSGDVRIVVEPV